MTSDQYHALKPGTVLYGFNKGSHFAVTVVEQDNAGTLLKYNSGTVRRWSKSHIKKYYRLSF